MIKHLFKLFANNHSKIKHRGINVTIKNGYFAHAENIKIGNNVYIGPDAYWDALGGIEIMDNVIIGPQATIWTYNHNYRSEKYLPYDEYEYLKKVCICQNVWIGLKASILPGVCIGEGAIIGMGSVVNVNVPPLAIGMGNPFKITSYRDEKIYAKLVKERKYYLIARESGEIKNKKYITKK